MSFIINTVNSCNLDCIYCYAPKLALSQLETVSDEIIIKLITGSIALGVKNVQFVWHGNEPTLAGRDFFRRMLDLQVEYGQPWQQFANVMQTNGTLIDESWLSFFKENNIGVGISIDGPAFIHNANRRRIGGGTTFNSVVSSFQQLREHDCDGGVCSVITKDSLGNAAEIVDTFEKLLIPEVDFLPCFPTVETALSGIDKTVTDEEYGNFMIEAFDKWWELNNPDFQVRTFETVIISLLGGEAGYCQFRHDKCQDFLGVSTEGDVYPCDLFVGEEYWKLGSLKEDDLWTIVMRDRSRHFLHAMQKIDQSCRDCKWLKICWGGCSFHRYLVDKDLKQKTMYCKSRKMLFEHISDVLDISVTTNLQKPLGIEIHDKQDIVEEVYVDLGSACNSNCYFCAADSTLNIEPIWSRLNKRTLMALQAKGHTHLIITGGEVTIHQDLLELIHFAKHTGFEKIHLQTNGRRLSNPVYLRELVDAGVDEFGMSMHGHTASLHDSVTLSPGSFVQTTKAIENLNFLFGARIPLAVNCVILPENARHLGEIVEYLIMLNVSTIKLSYLHGVGRARTLLQKDLWPSKTQIQPFVLEAIQTAEQIGKPSTSLAVEAIPFCLLPEKERYSSDLNITPVLVMSAETGVEKYHSGWDRVKGPQCKECKLEYRCLGPWKEYPKQFGWSEFTPITKYGIECLG